MNRKLYRRTACVIMLSMMHAAPAGTPAVPLEPCPGSPNCVSSLAPPDDSDHYIAPFDFTDTPENAWARLKAALRTEKRLTIVAERSGYLHAEARSLVFRFVDDLEFALADVPGRIQLRSAARTGYSDFGVNRRRIERLRAAFAAQPPM